MGKKTGGGTARKAAALYSAVSGGSCLAYYARVRRRGAGYDTRYHRAGDTG